MIEKNSKYHYYDYLDLLKKIMSSEDKETVDGLFHLQFSLFFTEKEINERQIKVLSRLLYRENLDSLLQSAWFLRKKYCSVAMTKEDMRAVIALARSSDSTNIDWDESLDATVNIVEHLRLIQSIIKPLFIWWVNHITPQLFNLYLERKHLIQQISQCENIALFEEKLLSNNDTPFLSLNDIKDKLAENRSRLQQVDVLFNENIKTVITQWQNEPVFNTKINGTRSYLNEVTPRSEILKPIWDILQQIPNDPTYCNQLKAWLLSRTLCLKNDEFLWIE